MAKNKIEEVNQAAIKAQTQWVRTLNVLDKLGAKGTHAILTVTGKTDTHNWKFVIHNDTNAMSQFRICVYAASKYSTITSFGEYKWNENPSTESLREHFRAVSKMN